jgi:hypothetical protein
MAVYQIFAEKSATLYSYYPATNTGLDEIVEISTFSSINETNEVSRAIIKFSTSDVADVVSNKIQSTDYDAYLKVYLANASEIPLNYTLYGYPVAKNWVIGTCRFGNYPANTVGVSWVYTDQSGSTLWTNGSFPQFQTGSYTGSVTPGGGVWWSNQVYESTQSFNNISDKDIEMRVTDIVKAWNNSTFDNNGIILKHSSSLEFTTASKFELKYFSNNTHTIYPPTLEFRWDDSSYSTGSLTIVTSSLFALTLGNNKGEFQQDSIQRFRVNVRDIYPSVAFRTSISYANSKALPSSSYWSIKDLDTEEIIVDYDTSYTKISCDANGNYFDVYMNGLEPERYYKLLIKAVVADKEVIISDKNYIFKVIR